MTSVSNLFFCGCCRWRQLEVRYKPIAHDNDKVLCEWFCRVCGTRKQEVVWKDKKQRI